MADYCSTASILLPLQNYRVDFQFTFLFMHIPPCEIQKKISDWIPTNPSLGHNSLIISFSSTARLTFSFMQILLLLQLFLITPKKRELRPRHYRRRGDIQPRSA